MGTRESLRKAAWRVAPAKMADRAHQFQHDQHDRWGMKAAAEAIGPEVVRGPFAGMHYPASRVSSVAKRVGAYESELYPWFEQALAKGPARFVDIGAADGFYAIGVARYGLPVEAFELARSARAEIEELAQLNRVAVDVRGRATPAALANVDFGRALVLCDCEGAEVDLLVPAVVSRLQTATVIVEVHEALRPGAEAVLRTRFAASHDVAVEHPAARDVDDFPEVLALEAGLRPSALAEGRTVQTPWLRFLPRA